MKAYFMSCLLSGIFMSVTACQSSDQAVLNEDESAKVYSRSGDDYIPVENNPSIKGIEFKQISQSELKDSTVFVNPETGRETIMRVVGPNNEKQAGVTTTVRK